MSNVSVSADGSLLQWSPPPNAPVGCISGYTIQWPGNSVNINNSSNSVQVSTLIIESSNSLPFCVTVPTTVAPIIPVVSSPLTSNQNSLPSRLVYQDPGMSESVLIAFTITSLLTDLPSPLITLQSSGSDHQGFDTVISYIPGIYQNQQCQPSATSGDSQLFSHSCSDAGTEVEFCVVFEYMECRKMSNSSRQGK